MELYIIILGILENNLQHLITNVKTLEYLETSILEHLKPQINGVLLLNEIFFNNKPRRLE